MSVFASSPTPASIPNATNYVSFAWFRFRIEPYDNIKVIKVFSTLYEHSAWWQILFAEWYGRTQIKHQEAVKNFFSLTFTYIWNILATLFGLAAVIVGTYKQRIHIFGGIMWSILLPTYYPNVFLLILTQYAMIVKPLKFNVSVAENEALQPKY